MSELEESYRALEIEPGATPDEIKRAYRALAKLWHPDRVSHHPQLRRRHEEKMRKINAAYEYLREHAVEPSPAAPPPEPRPRRRPAPEPEPEPQPEPQPEPEEPEAPPEPEPEAEQEPQGQPYEDPNPHVRRLPHPWMRIWSRRSQPRKQRPRRFVKHGVAKLASLWNVGGLLLLSLGTMAGFFISDKINMPTDHPYYGLLRIVLFITSVYGAFYSLVRTMDTLLLILLPIAFIFNPILPITISAGDWIVINLVTPLILLAVFFEMCRQELSGH